MVSSLTWKYLKSKIPSFYNSALRFALLRTICVFSIALLFTVPSTIVSYDTSACLPAVGSAATGPYDPDIEQYEVHRIVYSYVLYGFTLLHHFTSAFGPSFSLPNVIDVALIIGEALFFTSQSISGRSAPLLPLPGHTLFFSDVGTCKVTYSYPGITPEVSAFSWVAAISLGLLTCVRVAETIKSDGRHFFHRYDVVGLRPDADAEKRANGRRPNGFKVLMGVRLWEAHFEEGRQIVLFRGLIALVFMALILSFAFNSLIIDPVQEVNEMPVKTSMFAKDPTWWMSQDVYVVVGLPTNQMDMSDQISFSSIADAGVTVTGCQPIVSDFYKPTAQPKTAFYYTAFGDCTAAATSPLNIFVNFTRPAWTDIPFDSAHKMVMVMVGHSSDTSDIIRHTESPVDLRNGMNIVGSARQHIVRQFRYPGLSVFGLFTLSYDLVVSEISQIIPNGTQLTNGTASLTIYPGADFSRVKVVQDYRDKSILKGLSAVGGLWTFIAFIFGSLYGSSLVRVFLGNKPLSIFGVMHCIGQAETQKIYRKTYPHLDDDLLKLHDNPGLMTLLVDNLVDLEFISKEAEPTLNVEMVDVESTRQLIGSESVSTDQT